MSKIKLHDFEAVLLMETDAAYKLDTDCGPIWFPKSLTENNNDGTFTVPEWVAVEKGLA